jgi:alanine racemase
MASWELAAKVEIDLSRIRANVEAIQRKVGVPVYAVVKADAYGLGATMVAQAIADAVDAWCVFIATEAVEYQLWERTRKPTICLGPPTALDPTFYVQHHVRPAVSDVAEAAALREADPLLCVDTGMQRFSCPPGQIDEAIRAGGCREAFTHAPRLEHARRLVELAGGRGLKLHAAASSLLEEKEAWLDAVRPGFAMYRGAVRVAAPLVEAKDTNGPAGYTGFVSPRVGVIICGYSNGLRKGPCLVNGRKRRILEVGMQSAFVELDPRDREGDEVVLLGDELAAEEVAEAWGCTPHEVLVRLGGAGRREYR